MQTVSSFMLILTRLCNFEIMGRKKFWKKDSMKRSSDKHDKLME